MRHGASLQTPQTLEGDKGEHHKRVSTRKFNNFLKNWKLPDREGPTAVAPLRPKLSGQAVHGVKSRSVLRLHAEVLLQPLTLGNGRRPSSRTLTLLSHFLFTAQPLGIPQTLQETWPWPWKDVRCFLSRISDRSMTGSFSNLPGPPGV